MTRKELQDKVYKKFGSKGYVLAREYVAVRTDWNPFSASMGNEVVLYIPMSVEIGTAELLGDVVRGKGVGYEDAYLDAQKRSPLIWQGI